jgi:hypothetical protein
MNSFIKWVTFGDKQMITVIPYNLPGRKKIDIICNLTQELPLKPGIYDISILCIIGRKK